MRIIVACLLGASCVSVPALAAPVKIIHRFLNVEKGARPRAALTSDSAGNLYGTTYTGADDGNGTVFELSPPGAGSKKWVETVLHHFSTHAHKGFFPWSGVVLDKQGNLYGATSEGAINDAGTVFELVRPANATGVWHEVVLHDFTGRKDGGTPDGTLVFGADGNLYGTAGYGGSRGAGVVFRLSPNGVGGWDEDVLYNFSNGADGGYPFCTLTFDAAGAIYGTTLNGGNTGNGVVFELSPKGNGWKETVLHSFDSDTDGVEPRTGVMMDGGGNLYGTTESGGSVGYGTVFEVSPPAKGGKAWTEVVLHNFGFSPDGGTPGYSNLVMDAAGALYGTTQTGGTLKNGVAFRLVPPAQPGGAWTETVLHTFKGAPDGSQPESGFLQAADGTLIGTTLFGGASSNYGTVFQITP